MLATTPFYPHQHMHAPSRPSPLSERSANAAPRPFAFSFAMSSSQTPTDKKPIVPQRAYKPNPVVQTRDAAAQRRRNMFFKRVQKDREERKWEARGEQIQRLDYISERKRWEAEKARQSPQLVDDIIDEEVEQDATSGGAPEPELEVEEVDYLLEQEEYDLQELIASMEDEQENASQHYGSDDEDYDQIFMECTSDANSQSQQQQTYPYANENPDYAEDMDMSEG